MLVASLSITPYTQQHKVNVSCVLSTHTHTGEYRHSGPGDTETVLSTAGLRDSFQIVPSTPVIIIRSDSIQIIHITSHFFKYIIIG